MSSIQIEINFHLQGSYSIFNSNCIRNIGAIYTDFFESLDENKIRTYVICAIERETRSWFSV